MSRHARGAETEPAPWRLASRAALGAPWAVTLSAVLLTVSSVSLAWAAGHGEQTTTPSPVVSSEVARTSATAIHVRRGLDEAVDDLEPLARADVTDPQSLLDLVRDARPRYDSLGVMLDGRVVAGEERGLEGIDVPPVPAVVLGAPDSNEPAVFVSVPDVTYAGRSVVARYATDQLTSPLEGPGTAWLVDAEDRVLASDGGYIAYEQLSDSSAVAVVAAARRADAAGPNPADGRAPSETAAGTVVTNTDGNLYVAATLAGAGPAGSVGLTVVSRRPLSTLAVDGYDAQRRIGLFSALFALAALSSLGWLTLSVVLPLRRLARDALALADGDVRSPVVSLRLDEIGAVARHVERLRLTLSRGTVGGPR